MQRRRFLRWGATAATAPLLAGCTGGDGTTTPLDQRTEPPTPTRGPTETATATTRAGAIRERTGRQQFPDYDWDQLEDETPVEADRIVMEDFTFDPLVAEVSSGAEVTFLNRDPASHTVTIPLWDVDGAVSGGASATLSVDRTGAFDYVCAYHPPDMLGRLIVR